MNADVMAASIDALMPPLEQADARAARLASIKAMCQGMIEHIQTFAQITGACTGLATPPGGGVVAGVAVMPPGSIQ